MSTDRAVDEAPVRVLYLAGSGRSGTTVINSLLGQLPGAFAAGELRYLWGRGVVEDHRCGCGEPFSTCPVWTEVMADLPGVDPARADAVHRALLSRLRIARLPLLLARRALGRPPVPPTPDDELVAALYRSIARHTGAEVVIDSSKLPPYGLLLGSLPGIEVRVLHVVRDPRATAFSWRRTKATTDKAEGGTMPRLPVTKAAGLWLLWNALTRLWWPTRRHSRVVRFRYEDFVASPRPHAEAVARMAGLDPDALPFVGPDRVRLGPTHSVAGNPNRHTTGPVPIRSDDEWTRAMPAVPRRLVTLLAAPGILLFGYPWRRPATAAAVGRPDTAPSPSTTTPTPSPTKE